MSIDPGQYLLGQSLLGQHFWWLASRASGIVAMLLLTVAVLLGLMLGGKVSQKLPKRLAHLLGAEPRLVSKAHEQLSVAALIATGVHGVTLLGDAYIHPTLAQIAIPFTIEYRPVATGIGIVAGYIAVALGLSFYARQRIGAQTWRKLHRFTLVAYAMAVIHTITAGTDGGSAWLRTPMLATAALVAVMTLVRVSSDRPAAAAVAKTAGPTGAEIERTATM